MSEATKRPWTFHAQDGNRIFHVKRMFWELGGGDEKHGIGILFGDDDVDASLIVRAVNSHDLAVELANMVLDTSWPELVEKARAFLKAAKEEE